MGIKVGSSCGFRQIRGDCSAIVVISSSHAESLGIFVHLIFTPTPEAPAYIKVGNWRLWEFQVTQ